MLALRGRGSPPPTAMSNPDVGGEAPKKGAGDGDRWAVSPLCQMESQNGVGEQSEGKIPPGLRHHPKQRVQK